MKKYISKISMAQSARLIARLQEIELYDKLKKWKDQHNLEKQIEQADDKKSE